MTVQLTRDQDPPKTGLPNEGDDAKTFSATPATAHAEVTTEPVGSGPVVAADYSVPLIVTPDVTEVAAGGTITVTGSGLAANGSGTLELIPGPPGAGGEPVATAAVTADATGAIGETALEVPAGTEAGDYHLVLSGGAVVIDNTPITVSGATPGEPALTPDKTEVDGAGDDAARTITVAGTGFPTSTAGTVTLMTGAPGSGGTAVGEPADVTTDSNGGFVGAAVVVPEGTEAGDYHIVGVFGDATSDNTAITVTGTQPEPTITADKTEVDITGDETARTVTVTGTGFPANTAGTVFAAVGAPGTGGDAVGEPAEVTTDADGEFTAAAIVVPEGTAPGDYHIVATIDLAVSDDTALTVTGPAPDPVLSPDKTTVDVTGDDIDRTITVAGGQFPADTAGTVTLMTGAPGSGGTAVGEPADVTTDSNGGFVGAAVVVPEGTEAGDYHIVGVFGDATSDNTAITVTGSDPGPDPEVSPDVTEVAAGGTITVTGSGFPADTAGYVGLYDTTGTEIGTGAEVTTDSDGTFAGAAVVVPADAAAGDYVLRGTVADATSPDVTITVTGAEPEPVQLAAPADLAAGTPTATEIPVTWTAVDGATAYRIESSADGGATWTPDPTEPTEPDGVATGLTAATEYQIRVVAVGDGTTTTDSEPSAPVTATTAAAEAAKRSRKK